MGLTEQFIVIKDEGGADAAGLPRSIRRYVRFHGRADSGWQAWALMRPRPLESLDKIVAKAARGKRPALGAFVEDSDYAYVVVLDPEGAVARLLFNEHNASRLRGRVVGSGPMQGAGRGSRLAISGRPGHLRVVPVHSSKSDPSGAG